MKVVGIIAEYNPFHNGHLYQIKKIKEKYPDSIIIAVVSSSFTQRGDISILNKWDKTSIALDNNIDIVIELPFVYATQGSDIFGKGAVQILNNLNIDTIVFGTEEEDISNIIKAAEVQLNNKEYDNLVKKYLDKGLNYPTSTSKATYELSGYKIEKPNDLLALSYIKEVIRSKRNINIVNIKRTIDYHGNNIDNNITSASNIRKMLLNNDSIDNLIPYNKNILYRISMNNYFPLLKYQVTINSGNLSIYQTVDEGIENRLLKYIDISNTYEELINNIKTKRYTYNKISRMLLHILTNFTKEEATNIKVDYIRVLGFSKKGQKYLKEVKKNINIPIITGYKKNISNVLDIELRIAKIYSLITNKDLVTKEYRNKPIIK